MIVKYSVIELNFITILVKYRVNIAQFTILRAKHYVNELKIYCKYTKITSQ